MGSVVNGLDMDALAEQLRARESKAILGALKKTRCPKCKQEMKGAAFLMMGVEFKCFDCKEVVSCHEWEKKKYKKTKRITTSKKRVKEE